MNSRSDEDDRSTWADLVREGLSLNDLVDAAESLVERKQYDEAIALFEAALRLYPDSVALRLNLARVLDLKRRATERAFTEARADWEAQRDQAEILANNLVSLARIYFKRNQLLKALELLELARRMDPLNAELQRLAGQIYYEQMHYERALAALEEARRLDPFNYEIPHLQARIALERNDFAAAFTFLLDAFILSGGEQSPYRELYAEQVQRIVQRMGLDEEEVARRFRARKEHLNTAAEQLLMKRGPLTFETATDLDLLLLQLPKIEQARQSVLDIGVLLRRYPPFNVMTDEQVLAIAKQCSKQHFAPGDGLFHEDQALDHLYLVIDGEIALQKNTPFGLLRFGVYGPGEILGVMDFIDRMHAPADTVATRESSVLALSRTGLEERMIRDKFLGIQLYWHFWKVLSDRIRRANEQAQDFFRRMVEATGGGSDRERAPRAPGVQVAVDIRRKMEVLREKGLSASELRLLAMFSQEETYQKDQVIFHEGDPGDRLFVVLDGKVRISKFMEGIGEEALAILDRGEFFGEMALVDGQPRSADAIAHESDVTVLSIHRRVLNDILSRDPDSALRFLRILCRILVRRLREIYLKIFQWNMMAGMPLSDA